MSQKIYFFFDTKKRMFFLIFSFKTSLKFWNKIKETISNGPVPVSNHGLSSACKGALSWSFLMALVERERPDLDPEGPLTRGTFHSIKMPTVQYLLWLDKLSTPIHCCSPSDVIIVCPFAWLESAYHHLHIHSFPKRLVLLIISPPLPFLACVLLLLFHLSLWIKIQNSKEVNCLVNLACRSGSLSSAVFAEGSWKKKEKRNKEVWLLNWKRPSELL